MMLVVSWTGSTGRTEPWPEGDFDANRMADCADANQRGQGDSMRIGSFWKRDLFLSAFLVLAAFAGAAHVWIRASSRGGPWFERESDSLTYLSIADSLATGDGIQTFSGHSFALWTPFYPILLAFISFFGIDSVDAGLLVNAVAFGLIILLTGIWLDKHIESRFIVMGATVTIMTSYTITWLSATTLSEPLFVVLSLLALVRLGYFTESELPSRSALIWSAVLAASATVTRYIGVTIIMTAVLLILLRWRRPILKRIKYAIVYCIISIAPLMVWMIRNWVAIRHPVGNRNISELRTITFVDMLNQTGDIICLWVFSREPPRLLAILFWVVIGLIAITALGLLYIFLTTRVSDNEYLADKRNAELQSSNYLRIPFAFFITVYLVVLIGIVPFTADSDIKDRFLAPIFVPIVVVLSFGLYQLYRNRIWSKLPSMKWPFTLLVFIGWLGSTILTARTNLHETAERLELPYASYNEYTRTTEIIDFLIDSPINGRIYTNNTRVLYSMAVMYDVAILRQMNFIHDSSESKSCSSWIQEIAESDEQSFLVYFFEEDASGYCNPVELELPSTYLELVAETSDGVVYQVANLS